MKNGSRALSAGQWSGSRVAAGAADLHSLSSGRPETMGLGLRFMLRGAFLPTMVRSIARRASRPSRCVGHFFQILLRREAAKHAAQDEAESFESVCVISPFHELEHEGDRWKVLRANPREKVARLSA